MNSLAESISKFLFMLILTAFACFPAARCLAAGPAYLITDLGSLAGYASEATGINDNGQVVGRSITWPGNEIARPIWDIFVWDAGVLTAVDSSSNFPAAYGISNGGWIAGAQESIRDFGQTNRVASIWINGIEDFLFGPPVFFENPLINSNATAINDAGQIVGWSYDDIFGFFQENAFIREIDGSVTYLNVPDPSFPGRPSSAFGINDLGDVVGSIQFPYPELSHAALFADGITTDLGKFGGTYARATGINDSKKIVGVYGFLASGYTQKHAFSWDAGVFTDLNPANAIESDVFGITGAGQILMSARVLTDVSDAYLRQPILYDGIDYWDLSYRISGGSGWSLNEVSAINENGQIVGTGVKDQTGASRAILLTPVNIDESEYAELVLDAVTGQAGSIAPLINFTATVTNNGPALATGVVVQTSKFGVTRDGYPGCDIGNLAAGASGSCDMSSDSAVWLFSAKSNQVDPISDNNSLTALDVSYESDMNIAISAPGSVGLGQTIDYIVTVTNHGPTYATGVVTSGSLPGCSFFNTDVGQSETCTVSATADTFGLISQSMSVSSSSPDPNSSNNSASVSTMVVDAADLALLISAPDSVLHDQPVDYTMTVTNNGPGSATNVTVSGSLSVCTFASILPSDTATCTASVIAAEVGTLSQSMSVSSDTTDPDNTNNSVSASTTVVVSADLAVVMTASPDPVRKGAKLVYEIAVSNAGPDVANNVALDAVLPADIRFEKLETDDASCTGEGPVTCVIDVLGSGATATVRITIKPMADGVATATASVSANESDPDSVNNTASIDTQVSKGAKGGKGGR